MRKWLKPRIGSWLPHEFDTDLWIVVHRRTGEMHDVKFDGDTIKGSVFQKKVWAQRLARQLNEQE